MATVSNSKLVTDIGDGWKYITHIHEVELKYKGLRKFWRWFLRLPTTHKQTVIASSYFKQNVERQESRTERSLNI